MPEITKKLSINIDDFEGVYLLTKDSLLGLDATDIKETNTELLKEIEGVIPSVWGWGGMKIRINLHKIESTIEIAITGYIAQLAASPLTKNMDKLILLLSNTLKEKYNYTLEYDNMTRFIPNYKLNITNKDKTVFVIILVVAFISTLGGLLFGKGVETMLWVFTLVENISIRISDNLVKHPLAELQRNSTYPVNYVY